MRVQLPCGCSIDDVLYSTFHLDGTGSAVGDLRSSGDVQAKHAHYPLGLGPGTFCRSCDQFRPCCCDSAAAVRLCLACQHESTLHIKDPLGGGLSICSAGFATGENPHPACGCRCSREEIEGGNSDGPAVKIGKLGSRESKTVSITNCARCGEQHKDLSFQFLTQPMAPDDCPGIVWDHWASCPTNGEPILLRIVGGK